MPPNFQKIKILGAVFLPLIISIAIYSNTFDSPFVFDDLPNITENKPLTSLDPSYFLTWEKIAKRSLSYLTFMLNYKWHGIDTTGYHVVNILIHSLVGTLIFLLLNVIDKLSSVFKLVHHKKYVFLLISLIWLVNPVHTQSVTYIVQRMNSLATLFYLLSWVFYLKGRFNQIQKRKRYISLLFSGSVLCFFLALASKQNAVTLPIIILLTEFILIEKSHRLGFKKRYLFGAGLFMVFLCLIMVQNFNLMDYILAGYERRDFTLEERLLTQLRVVLFYIYQIVFPHPSNLNLEHDFSLSHGLLAPPTTLIGFVVILGLLILAWVMRNKQPIFSFCVFGYFTALSIESSFIALEIIFEHRSYLPSIFVLTGLLFYLNRFLPTKVFFAFSLCVFCLFSFWTYERNKTWKDEITLLEDCVQKSPNKSRPVYNLANAYADAGRSEKAIKWYKKAVGLAPEFASYRTNLAIELTKTGNYEEAEKHLLAALKIQPDYSYSLNAMANLYRKMGDLNKAEAFYKKNVSLNSEDYAANRDYANFLMQEGQFNQAIPFYHKVLKLEKNHDILNNLGSACAASGNLAQGIYYMIQAVQLAPDNMEYRNNLDRMVKSWRQAAQNAKTGQTEEAKALEDKINQALRMIEVK